MYYNRIPVDEIKDIQPLFNKVIAYSQGIDIDKICSDKTFATWARNKVYYYRAFGNKCIREFGEVEIHLPKYAKEKEFRSFVRWLDSNYGHEKNLLHMSRFLSKISAEEFFDNKLQNSILIRTYEHEEKTLPAGTKIIRAFKFCFENEDILRKIQDKASEIIQQDKTKGILCLSIHPLDFLSLSENASNWRSCHALDGEFRAGNLSYLMDTSTVIAYIKAKEDKKITRFPFLWNDKKWRNLLFFDVYHSAVFAGRPYPFGSLGALIEVKKALSRLPTFENAIKNKWREDRVVNIAYEEYDEETEEYTEMPSLNSDAAKNLFNLERSTNKFIYNPIAGSLYSIEDLMKEDQNQFCHYNDLLYSSTYFPLYLFLSSNPWLNYKSFEIGHDAYCLIDESHIIDPENDTSLMTCADCAENYDPRYQIHCENCNASVIRDEAIYLENLGTYICPRCYENEMTTCERCGERLPRNFLYYKNNDRSLEGICGKCFFNMSREERREWQQLI